ncbi:hypothetical protein PENTCL1PPCAC_3917, partial [Pristionchus entomophagus]
YILYIQAYLTRGIIMYNVIDLTTLTINAIGIKFCEGRYKQLYGNGTLNARYQVNEAYLLAKAMHPVYLGSFIIKIFSACIAYAYIFLPNNVDVKIHALIETVYFLVHAFNCAFSSTYLMMKHKSLRRAVRKMYRRKKRNQRKESLSIVAYTKEECSVTYFNMLDSSWQ